MYRIHLPEKVTGNYWITDEYNNKLVNIVAIKGVWCLKCYPEIRIIEPSKLNMRDGKFFKDTNVDDPFAEIPLQEYSMYYIAIDGHQDLFVLYSTRTFEDFTQIKLNTDEVLIGNSPSAQIQYTNPLVSTKHARIFLSDGSVLIENFDNNFGTFLNDKPIYKERCYVFNGDIIFIMELKIIVMGNTLYINNPLGAVKFDYPRLEQIVQPKVDFSYELEDEIGEGVSIKEEAEYFSRSPRITDVIEHEVVRIDSPPAMESKEGTPFIYIIGSSLSMGMISILSSYATIRDLSSGKITFENALPSLGITFALLVSSILLPILNLIHEKKKKKKYEEKRQSKYRGYIVSKTGDIKKIVNKQKNILTENYLPPEKCRDIIMTDSTRLWERKIDDDDFLTVRIGVGDVPLDAEINYPEKKFTMDDDDLIDTINEIAEDSQEITNAPVTVSLLKKFMTAFVAKTNYEETLKQIQEILLQLITFHCPDDLKIVFLMQDNIKKGIIEQVKILPHVWDNTRQIRFYADNYDDMKEVSKYLEEEFNRRTMNEYDIGKKAYKPYYLIITDNYKTIKHLGIISRLRKMKQNVGFSLVCFSNNLTDLPDETQYFVCFNEDKGIMFESENTRESHKTFEHTPTNLSYFNSVCKHLALVPVKYSTAENTIMIDTLSFLEMYDVGKIEQLNILQRWKTNDTTVSLNAPIGIDPAGMIIGLDIHEKFHGPHGLIAGSTGSGKSETIITYILSLAVNYHPDDLSFILIDYKGGGLAGAFQKGDYKLPHLIGTITNIETAGLQRSLASINSELRRRQIMFNEARNMTDGGTIDIYKYQKLYHDGVIPKPIPHLLIICDEFAELKEQQPDFMDELISVARIGRSLGVHLILATQKPAGIVNDQIRSNSKFAICLRVQDRSDSLDVINTPDAAYLTDPGKFYMEVGNNEYYTLGLSAWSGALYYPQDLPKKQVDNSIKFISNIGKVVKKVDTLKTENKESKGDQLTALVKYISNLAKQENIKPETLWIKEMPEDMYLDQIKKQYRVKTTKNIIKPTIGVYDDPENQRQGPLYIDFAKSGNTIIYGNAQSGKETLLSTIVYDTITTHMADEAQIYIFDFGSEALKIFKDAPQVGDVLFANDAEKIGRFFNTIQNEIRRRTEILSDYGGSYELYKSDNPSKMPRIIWIINNYESFAENYNKEYEDIMMSITRDCVKCGINFVVTASSGNEFRYRLSKNFNNKLALQLNHDDDYFNIWENIGKKRPSKLFGRGLIKLGDNIHEFQTAKVIDAEHFNAIVKETIKTIKEYTTLYAEPIPVLPNVVSFSNIKQSIDNLTNVPIGIDKEKIEVYRFNFMKNMMNIVSGKNIDVLAEYAKNLLEVFRNIPNTHVVVFDNEKYLGESINPVKNEYKNFMLGLQNDLYKNKNVICLIVDLDKFIQNCGGNIAEALVLAEQKGNYKFVIVDTFGRIKAHEYDDWYRKYQNKDTGIWVGNGIRDQYLIALDNNQLDLDNTCGKLFGYAVWQGDGREIKLYGMEE